VSARAGRPAAEALRAFARASAVSAEIRPHYDVHDHCVVQSGFDLALLALRSSLCPGDPGCAECERVHATLLDIALAVLPPGWRRAAEPFEAAFRYRRETRWRPEIEAVVQMLPVDPADSRELDGVRRRLRELGVGDDEARPSLGRVA
jgi:hypothetical protein